MDRITVIQAIEVALTEVLEEPVQHIEEGNRLFDDLQLDSTSVLELLMSLEDSVGFEVDPEEIAVDNLKTVGTLADFVLASAPASVAS